MTEKANPRSAIRTLAAAAMILAISLVSFSLFRGATNILNAFLVPLTLAIGSLRLNWKSYGAVLLALAGLTALLFPVQFVFVALYGALAALIRILLQRRFFGVSILIHAAAVSIGFWLAILLTDLIFLTRMQAIMMQVLGNNALAYAGLLLVEGLIVGSSQLLLARILYKRLAPLEKRDGH